MSKNDLTKAFDQLDIRKRNKDKPLPGILGFMLNGKKTVEVPTRPGFVFVRLRNTTNELIQAYNGEVSPVYDLPVLVDRDGVDKSRYRVIGRDLGAYQNWGSSSGYLPRHGPTHSFSPDTSGGGDIVFVYGRQMMPLAVMQSGSSGAGCAYIESGIFYQAGKWVYAGNTGTANLLPAKPSAGNARMLLVYLDENGNPGIATGTVFSESLTGTASIIPYLPNVTSNYYIPLAGIRLTNDTTAILWDNIYDVRPWIVGDGFIPTGSFAPNNATYITINNESGLSNERRLVAGAGIVMVDDGANSTLTISATGTSGGSPSSTGTYSWNAVTFIPYAAGNSIEYPKTDEGLIQAIADNTGVQGTLYIPDGSYTINTGTSSSLISYIGQSLDRTIININVGNSQEYAFKTGNSNVSIENLQFNIDSDVDFVANPTPRTHYGVYIKGCARNVLVNMTHLRAANATGAGLTVQGCTIVAQNYDTDKPYPTVENVFSFLDGSCYDVQVLAYKSLIISSTATDEMIYANNVYGYADSNDTHAYGLCFTGGGKVTGLIGNELRKVSKLSNARGLAKSLGTTSGNMKSVGTYLSGIIELDNVYGYANAVYDDAYYSWGGYSYSAAAFLSDDSFPNIFRFFNCNAEVEFTQNDAHSMSPSAYGYKLYLDGSLTSYNPYSMMKDCRAIIKSNNNGPSNIANLKLVNTDYITYGNARLDIYNSTFNTEDDEGIVGNINVFGSIGGTAQVFLYDCVVNNILYGYYTSVNNVSTVVGQGLLIYDDNTFMGTGTSISFNDNLDVHVTGTMVWVDGQVGGGTSVPTYPAIYNDGTFKSTGTAIHFNDNLSVVYTGTSVWIDAVAGTGTAGPPGASGPPGSNTILVYDDGVFKVTGTAVVFGTNLDIAVTGSTAFVNSAYGRVLIGENTPTSTGTSFTNLPQIYRSLEAEIIGRTDRATNNDGIEIKCNGDNTRTNYRRVMPASYGTNTVYGEGDNDSVVGWITATNAPSNSAGQIQIKIIGYADSVFNKQIQALYSQRYDNSSIQEASGFISIEWENNSPITRIDFVTFINSNFISGTKIRLYGVY